ncbi:MAG: hypothetical protein IJI98_09715 [Methanosphaera sp.]|nr:hypothetical protein [Methanosphaera sp.]
MQDLQKKLLQEHNITVHTYENVTVEDIPALLKKIDKITATQKDSIIQLLHTDNICGQKHLNQAIAQAYKAFSEQQNFANDRGLEICVRLSAQKQISQALKMLGIQKQGNITVVYIDTTSEQIQKTEELLGTRNDELLEQYNSEKICETYGINSDVDITCSINEKIALLALKN